MWRCVMRACRCWRTATVPVRQSKPCRVHPYILIADGGWCSLCGPQSRPRDVRPSAARRGYGADHNRKRDALRARQPYCQDPFRRHPGQLIPMSVRDHIVPLSQGGTDDEANEQALCTPCHNYKIHHDGSRGGKKVLRGGRRPRVAFGKKKSFNVRNS